MHSGSSKFIEEHFFIFPSGLYLIYVDEIVNTYRHAGNRSNVLHSLVLDEKCHAAGKMGDIFLVIIG